MARIRSSSRKLDTVFVMALFTLFAATAILVVLIAARQYKATAASMEQAYEERTATSFLREAVRSHDKAECISLGTFCDIEALIFEEELNGYKLITYIYYYNGYIRELTTTEGAVVSPDSGTALIEADDISITLEDSVLSVVYTDTKHTDHTLYITLHCGVGKEGA